MLSFWPSSPPQSPPLRLQSCCWSCVVLSLGVMSIAVMFVAVIMSIVLVMMFLAMFVIMLVVICVVTSAAMLITMFVVMIVVKVLRPLAGGAEASILRKEVRSAPVGQLSGIVSCDAAAIRIRIRIVRYQRPAKHPKHKPCEAQFLFCFPPFSPLTRAISRRDACDKKTLRFVCPSCTRDTDGVAAKLLRCGIASEALRRNMPLSWSRHLTHPLITTFGHFCVSVSSGRHSGSQSLVIVMFVFMFDPNGGSDSVAQLVSHQGRSESHRANGSPLSRNHWSLDAGNGPSLLHFTKRVVQ